MYRSYEVVSPSLEGVIDDESLSYARMRRPSDLLRVLDGPAAKGKPVEGAGAEELGEGDRQLLENYFHDLHVLFMKKVSSFVLDPEVSPEEIVKIQAMFQEMIKVKKLMKRPS